MLLINKKLINKNINIAFSCGEDSICLAYLLKKRSPVLLHFNHKLISEDDRIEQDAIKFADFFNLKIVIGRATDKYISGSQEAWCREQRYKWFKSLELDIFTAHHLNDAAEHYLMNCLTGLNRSLTIPVVSNFGKSKIIRPFLLSDKKDISKFVKDKKLKKFVSHDPLNEGVSKLRNWTRKILLPIIKTRKDISVLKVVRKKVLDEYKKVVDYSSILNYSATHYKT
jgi:tRNA(Ile)-lysidine synthetase-like protein